MKNLGFGMMRLPVLGGDPTNFDYPQLNEMVDTFLRAGEDITETVEKAVKWLTQNTF